MKKAMKLAMLCGGMVAGAAGSAAASPAQASILETHPGVQGWVVPGKSTGSQETPTSRAQLRRAAQAMAQSPGSGSWICPPSGAGQRPKCFRR